MYFQAFLLFRMGVFSLLTFMATARNGEVQCGIQKIVRKIDKNARIVNGVAAYPGEWPWQVMVLQNGYQICGGTLIHSKWVMTAAHCITGNVKSHSEVILGATKKDRTDNSVVKAAIESLHCNDKYVADNTFENDICLIKLTKPVEYSDYILPACLPKKNTTVTDDTKCIVTGWGETLDPEQKADLLQKASVSIINKKLCRTWYGNDFVNIPDAHLCAGHAAGGTDTCQGDSGGPLVCLETTTSASEAYVVRGITSFGIGCALKQRPGVYTKVVEYVNWIEETTGIKFEEEKKIEVTTAQTTIPSTESTTKSTTLSLILIPEKCGGLIKSRITIMSNMSQGNYANKNCTWNIDAPNGYWISVTNVQFLLPVNKSTCNNLLKIILGGDDVLHIDCTKERYDVYEIQSSEATLIYIHNDNKNVSSDGVSFTVEFAPIPITTTKGSKREMEIFTTYQPNTGTSSATNIYLHFFSVIFFILGKTIW